MPTVGESSTTTSSLLILAEKLQYDRDAAQHLLERYGTQSRPRKVAGEHLFYNCHDRVEALLSPQLTQQGLIVPDQAIPCQRVVQPSLVYNISLARLLLR